MPTKPLRRLLFHGALLAVALPTVPAGAQHAHDHKPRHGGIVREANDFVYELEATPTRITVWVTDEANKPVPTTGSSATLALIDSGKRADIALVPAGENRLAATGTFALRPGMGALLEVSVGGKTVAKLRYTLK